MYSNKKNKKKQKFKDEDKKEESHSQNQNINNKKNLSASSNKHNLNDIQNENNINNIDNIDNDIEQINSFNKKKKKRDKKKSNRLSSNNNYNEEKNNNIKFLNNANLTNSNLNQNINNFNFKPKEPSNQQKLEEANSYMQQMNFIKAEKQYKSILETCGNSSNQFMINLLNNYSICLLNQRKLEEGASFATKIILEYDNKNKRAYLTMLTILYNIKEYKKAMELVDRVNILFKKPKDIEYFKNIINDINNAINEEEENKIREIYYNKEKKIVDLIQNKWIHIGMYSLGTFLGGYALYKLISNK